MHEGYGLLLRGYYVPSVYIYDLIYNLVPLEGQMWETGNSCVLFIEFLHLVQCLVHSRCSWDLLHKCLLIPILHAGKQRF